MKRWWQFVAKLMARKVAAADAQKAQKNRKHPKERSIRLESLENRTVPALLFGVDSLGTTLLSFNSNDPGTQLTSAPITGLQIGETIVGMDFRPATGQLFAMGLSGGNVGRLYTIDVADGTATQVGTDPFSATLTGNSFGFDFIPTQDRIRVVSDSAENFRINPSTGELAGSDSPLSIGSVGGLAFDRSMNGSTATTAFGIDFANDTLVRIGGVDGVPSSSGGTVTTIGPLGVNTSGLVGFDITFDTNNSLASLTVGGVTSLYSISLGTGSATQLGDFPVNLRALAALPQIAIGTAGADNYVVTPNGTSTNTVLVTLNGVNLGAFGNTTGSPVIILALDGDDLISMDPTITGGASVLGGSGNDTVISGGGADTLVGSTGADSLFGGAGNDSIVGGDDNDTLSGGTGTDTVRGEEGNDSFLWLAGDGADSIEGGNGTDIATVTGGASDDIIVVSANGAKINVAQSNNAPFSVDLGTMEVVSVNGGAGADTISSAAGLPATVKIALNGNAGDDSLFGNDGGETLNGEDGNDTIQGGAGNDTINGGVGNDSILGGNDDDLIFGGDGADRMDGGAGNDSIDGQLGNDLIFGNLGNDLVFGGVGSDSIDGNDGSDSLDGGADNDLIFGSAGNDLIFGRAGADSLDGGAGNDALDGGSENDAVFGSGDNDVLFGSEGADSLDGNDGNDSLDGGADSDVLFGSGGNDLIFGSGGADSIDGNDGNDSIDGGADNDLIFGSSGNDLLFGSSGNDVIDAGQGDDSVDGNDGNDLIFAGAGDDLIFGSAGNDSIDGSDGNDTIDGSTGTDQIFGGAGTNLIFDS